MRRGAYLLLPAPLDIVPPVLAPEVVPDVVPGVEPKIDPLAPSAVVSVERGDGPAGVAGTAGVAARPEPGVGGTAGVAGIAGVAALALRSRSSLDCFCAAARSAPVTFGSVVGGFVCAMAAVPRANVPAASKVVTIFIA